MIENPFFERHKDFDIDYSDILPHWHQWGKMQYITFRLADSLPQSKIAVLKQIRADFEANNPRPWDEQTKRNFYKTLSPYENRMLDAGLGSCVLANKEAREVLERVLQKFNGPLYEIVAYVIMPNHVHIVMIMNENISPDVAMKHIWQHSTYHINRTIGQHGALWQKTYYDRIVRNAESLKHFVKYIYNNPQKLPKENYSIYRNENWSTLLAIGLANHRRQNRRANPLGFAKKSGSKGTRPQSPPQHDTRRDLKEPDRQIFKFKYCENRKP